VESRYQRETNEVVVDQTVHITDVLPVTIAKTGVARADYHYYLAPWETVCIVDSNATSAFTVYLPPVAEMKGKVVCVTSVAGDENVTVDDLADDSSDWPKTLTLGSALDRVALYSDGIRWFVICDQISG